MRSIMNSTRAWKIVTAIALMAVVLVGPASAAVTNWRIMPLGNSLTAGLLDAGSDPIGGYRDDLYQLLTDELTDDPVNIFNFVGTQSDGSGFDFDHEGHPGWSLSQINAQLDAWLVTATPDIVLLMGGTNDIRNGIDDGDDLDVLIEEVRDNLEDSIDKIYGNNNATKIVLASISPMREGSNEAVIEANILLTKLYYEKLEAGYPIYYAGIYEMFTANPTWRDDYMYPLDLIHCSNAGYEVMAHTYFNAVMNAINNTDPIVTDNFNRKELDTVWDAPSNFVLTDGELSMDATGDAWQYLGVYKGITSPTQINAHISAATTAADLQYFGIGALLESPLRTSGGYFIRFVTNTVELWTLNGGAVQDKIASMSLGTLTLDPGDDLRVAMVSNAAGHHFDIFINDESGPRISDPEKLKGNTDDVYSGLFFRGGQNVVVDNFYLYKSSDSVPPDAIVDLEASAPGANSVTLTWTAPGDDGLNDTASGYDIRYSTNILSEASFGSATQAGNTPMPEASGTQQTVAVTGLDAGTKYFFAMKTYDEAGNMSGISNIVSMSTTTALMETDDFERVTLGPDWVAGAEFVIQNGDMVNTASDDSWAHLAVYTARQNPIEVQLEWSLLADTDGIDQGGLALMMDQPSTTASGYLLWRRTTQQKLYLWEINGGTLGNQIAVEPTALVSPPQPGGVFKVVVRSDATGNHFDCYTDDQYEATISDAAKRFGVGGNYAGVVLHSGLNNAIESFGVVNTVGEAAILGYVSGNNQEGAVGKALPLSIVVQVTDEDGMPVSNHAVDFSITGGDGHFDKEVANDGNIRIEGEDADLVGMYTESNAECSGGEFITGGTAAYQSATAGFRFYVAEAGEFYIWARVNPEGSSAQNTWEWKIDDSQNYVWDSQPKSQNGWKWCPIGTRGNGAESNPEYFYWPFDLSTGWHTFTLIQRESNTKLDKVLITNRVDYTPTDKEEYPEYRTDTNGEAIAIWTLGTEFGVNNNTAQASAIGLDGSPINFIASALGDVPAQIEYISGNGQAGAGGSQLLNPLKVKVTDEYGNPRKNHPVTFTVTHGGGEMVSAQPVLTDDDGFAQDYIVLGTEDNTTTVEVVSEYEGVALSGSPIPFSFSATSMVAHRMAYVRGNNQTGYTGDALADPLEVQIFDDQGNAIPNHPVTFEVTTGSGTLDGGVSILVQKTDATGKATVILTLSTAVDTNVVEARSLKAGSNLSGSPVVFNSHSVPKPAHTLVQVSGNNQTGAGGNNLANPLVVQVTDEFGNAVVGHQVLFTVTNGGGKLNGLTSKVTYSDGEGQASVVLTLGVSATDTNKVVASSNLAGTTTPLENSPVLFKAISGIVSDLELISGPSNSGSAGYSLDNPFVIEIRDNYGNPVPGFSVDFKVITGQNGGNFYGATDTSIVTGDDGRVSTFYTMGYSPSRTNSVKIEAYRFGVPLSGSPISIDVVAYAATELQYEAGNGPKDFRGTAGLGLSDSVKTKVIDDHGRLMKYFPITYTITSGGGSVNNQSSVTSITNAKGFAAVDWVLGPTPGSWNNSMQATAQYDGTALTHSPRLFRATADQGEPTILVVDAQADSQTTAVGGILAKPIRVSVTDPAGNPIIGHPVRFRIVGGGGKINDVTTELVQYVDSNGYAEVNWRIGNTAGWSNFMEVSAEFDGQALDNSPYLFSAYGLPSSATQLIRVSEQNIDGTVGEALTSPFQVRVGDTNGNGVSGLSVTFEILSGGGSLNGSTDTLVVATSAVNGMAEATLTLGPTVGVMNTIRVRGFNGEIELQNSPIYFTSTGQPGALNLDTSEITCDPATVPAGAEVTVGVRLSDTYGNAPTTRYWIRFYTESEGVTVTQQPSTQTDQNGLVFGKIMCTRSGNKEIKAEVLGAGWITNPGRVFYYPLLAHHIGGQSGDQQTGNVNASLANPLGVTVYDVFGNPVPNSPVHFAAGSGGCEIYEAQPVTTDSSGQAFSHLVLGPNSGTNTASVTATELEQTLYYSATGTISTARHISVYSGNNQIGKAGVELSAPLVVQVTDAYGRPVFNHTVRFSVEFGNGTFRGVEAIGVPTDPLGLATAYFTLDDDIGHNTVRAESPQIYSLYGEFVTFILQGQAGYAEVLKMISGDGSSVQVYSQATLNVQTTDIHGNGVGNIPVSFRVAEGTAEIVQAQPVMSNENGYASSTVRVSGAVGDIVVEATSAGLINSPLQMKLYVTAAQASSMELADGNNQNGTISRDLPFPFEVLVKDSWGNPVPGEIIAWSVIQGSGYISSTTRTGSDGIAKNTLRLGPNAGINEVYALNNSLGAPLPFTAQGVTNKFPIINAIDDITVNENQNINFTVRANDDDGETIYFGAQAGTLPSGAYYDSTGSQQFYWTPTYTDAGEYDVVFLVQDPRGGIGAENVKLTVQNVNRMPIRTSSWPLSYYVTADRLTGQPVPFSITVADPDPDDTISYQWYLTDKGQKTPDSLLVSTNNTYTYQPLEYPNGAYMVSVIVSDGHDILRLEWWLSNKDAVELASFSGEAMEYNGVRLSWETSYENNNAGFNILRSASENGDYERLTRVPLPASEEMVYEYFDNRIEAGRTYYYRLEDVDMTGKRTMHAPISVEIGRPETFELTQNYPNPFNPETHIRYQLPETAQVKLYIYNIRGQLVKKMVDAEQAPGVHTITWNGLNKNGHQVASGIYFYLIQANDFKQTKRMLLLR